MFSGNHPHPHPMLVAMISLVEDVIQGADHYHICALYEHEADDIPYNLGNL